MKISDKKFMIWLVFVSIILGLLMIFFLKPDYEIGRSVEGHVLEEDFSDLFDEFSAPETEETFINKENKQDNKLSKESVEK